MFKDNISKTYDFFIDIQLGFTLGLTLGTPLMLFTVMLSNPAAIPALKIQNEVLANRGSSKNDTYSRITLTNLIISCLYGSSNVSNCLQAR
ncbi:hypothetical protein OIU84_012245 [Salix udensis]|uniref:Uncharacterized protein n=1 Tax=Salix udensis TaxID=889485 RepID=A0AAD6JH47_9ROSI|nr:hypothetical protein OIU84_012245 [Salix udensis]